jgi:hypothetical protein
MFKAQIVVPDPGNAGAINPLVEGMHNICRLVSVGAETRILLPPTRDGQEFMFNFETDGGDIVITTEDGDDNALAFDEAGNSVLTFANVGEYILLKAIRVTSTTFAWRVVSSDGVTGAVKFGDDVDLFFGDDKDVSIEYNSTVSSMSLKVGSTAVANVSVIGMNVGTAVQAGTAVGTDQLSMKSTGTAPTGTGANAGHLYADFETDDDELFWLSGTVGTATQLTT